jgi:heme exporter protein A
MTKNHVIISVSHLEYQRNLHTLFSNVSFAGNAGQAIQIAGANGSGKTTLLYLLMKLLQPTKGSVQLNIEQVGYLGHKLGIKQNLTAIENVYFASAVSKQQAKAILERVALTAHNTLCQALSAGQQRRVAIALLLAKQKNIWLLDEPFTALDKQGVKLLIDLMSHHLKEGGIIIFTSHQQIPLPFVVNTIELTK